MVKKINNMKKINPRDILTKIAKKLIEDGISFSMLAEDGCHSTIGCHSSNSGGSSACHSSSSNSSSSSGGCHTSSRRSGHG